VFAISLTALILILVLEKANFLLNMTHGSFIPMSQLFRLVMYFLPAFLVISIPLASLLASLVTFSQLSSDNEITALRACGVSFRRILMPVSLFALLSFGASLYLALEVQHVGRYKFISLLNSIISRKINATIDERVFFDRLPNTVMYVNEKPSGDSTLKGVFIYDKSDPKKPKFISAQRGSLIPDDTGRGIVLNLKNGNIYTGDRQTYRMIRYSNYTFSLYTGEMEERFMKGEREMPLSEIIKNIKKMKAQNKSPIGFEVEMHKRFSLPFACLVFSLLGAPLGVRVHRGGRYSGVGTGVVMIIVNYVLLMLGEGLGRGGQIQPALALWMPNIIMGTFAWFLIYKASRESMPFKSTVWLQWLWHRAVRRLSGYKHG